MGSNATRNTPTVTGFALACAIKALAKRHIEAQPLLNRAGLSDYDPSDRQRRIPASNQGRFLHTQRTLSNDPSFGLHLAEASDPRESGLLYYISSAAKDLWGTLSLFLAYSKLVDESLRLEMSRLPDVAIVEFRFDGVSPQSVRHNTEFWVVMIIKGARQISGRHIRPLRVAFPHTSGGNVTDFKQFFGCPVEFGAPIGQIEFSSEALSLPRADGDPHLLQILKPVCDEAAKARGTAVGSVRALVETEVQRRLPRGGAQLETIAKALAMSKRTLSRRLSAEGTNLSEIVDDVRRSLALEYVSRAAHFPRASGLAPWLRGIDLLHPCVPTLDRQIAVRRPQRQLARRITWRRRRSA